MLQSHVSDNLRVPQSFGYPENLESALRRIAMGCKTSGAEEIALCVDAICIDQSNIVERTHQVSQMDQVYKNAFRTIILLGSRLRAVPLR